MKKTTHYISILLSSAAFSVGIFAQEYGHSEEHGNVQIVETDAAAKAVQEAQEVPLGSVERVQSATAEQQLKQFISKRNWNEGWDSEKKRFFQVGVYTFDCEDPSYDDSFITLREVAAKSAALNAKAKIIEFVKTNMSAKEKLTVPGTDVYAELGAELRKQEKKLEAQKRVLKKLGKELELAEAKNLEGVTMMDRTEALVDALIKKLDVAYDAGKIEAKKAAQYERAKIRFAEAQKEMQEIEAKAESLSGGVTAEFKSEIETLASMPLYGATCISQTESWDEDEEKFQVAMLFCWSPKLERAARAVATLDDNYVLVPPKKPRETVSEWLSKQDLGVMVGSRQYLDGDGRRYFLGITARLLGESSYEQEKARDLTEMFAKQMAVFSIMSDVKSHKKAIQVAERRSAMNAKDYNRVAESFAKEISQELRNQPVRGLAKLYSTVTVHPIAQRKIYVAVYGISADTIKDCRFIEDQQYATKAQQIKARNFEKGRDMANQQAVRNAQMDSSSTGAGYSQAMQAHENELKKRNELNQPATPVKVKNSDQTAGGKARSGSFMSGTDVEDDF